MLYRVLLVFCLLFLVVFAAAVRCYGMEAIFAGRIDMLSAAAWDLYPCGNHCSARLFGLFCFPSLVFRWRVFHIFAHGAVRGCDRLSIVYHFADVVDRVRSVRIDVARLVFVVVL